MSNHKKTQVAFIEFLELIKHIVATVLSLIITNTKNLKNMKHTITHVVVHLGALYLVGTIITVISPLNLEVIAHHRKVSRDEF